MKAKTIWMIVGVIVLILIVANWNKIFGQKKKPLGTGSIYRAGGYASGRSVSVPCDESKKGTACAPGMVWVCAGDTMDCVGAGMYNRKK